MGRWKPLADTQISEEDINLVTKARNLLFDNFEKSQSGVPVGPEHVHFDKKKLSEFFASVMVMEDNVRKVTKAMINPNPETTHFMFNNVQVAGKQLEKAGKRWKTLSHAGIRLQPHCMRVGQGWKEAGRGILYISTHTRTSLMYNIAGSTRLVCSRTSKKLMVPRSGPPLFFGKKTGSRPFFVEKTL